jgi:Trk K+ transport system NAD-binding subunit
MKIAVVGRGNVGGGLADRWEEAGHDVTRLGKDGGDVSAADAVLLAVPGAGYRRSVRDRRRVGWQDRDRRDEPVR